MPLNVLDLFSGIGGFTLGLERAGMRTVAFCECDRYARAVLAKHWPLIPCYDDIRTLTARRLAADGIRVDLICGGFPCQDISVAGTRTGLAGSRSGLWREFARLVGELRPRFVIVENTAALLGRGFGEILGDLAAFGFDAEWHCIPASAVGAPHRRDRAWIVAYADRDELRHYKQRSSRRRLDVQDGRQAEPRDDGIAESVANADRRRRKGERLSQHSDEQSTSRNQIDRRGSRGPRQGPLITSLECFEQWAIEPDVGRVADGIPGRVDRLRCLGNAVVPQIVEVIGREIMRAA